jgi:hypothetical protein
MTQSALVLSIALAARRLDREVAGPVEPWRDPRMRSIPLLPILLLVASAGCSGDRRAAHGAALAPAATRSESAFAMLSGTGRDCLQYPTAKYADGTEDWNADWIFFSLVQTSDSTLARDSNGKPIAASLLFSQAAKFMNEHGETPGTGWTWVVKRMKRHVREGQVLSQSDYAVIDDADLADLIHKDRLARSE